MSEPASTPAATKRTREDDEDAASAAHTRHKAQRLDQAGISSSSSLGPPEPEEASFNEKLAAFTADLRAFQASGQALDRTGHGLACSAFVALSRILPPAGPPFTELLSQDLLQQTLGLLDGPVSLARAGQCCRALQELTSGVAVTMAAQKGLRLEPATPRRLHELLARLEKAEPLVQKLSSRTYDEACAATDELEEINDPEVLRVLAPRLVSLLGTTKATPSLGSVMRRLDAATLAAHAAGLAAILAHEDKYARNYAMDALIEAGGAVLEAHLPSLLPLFDDDSPLCRLKAMGGLATLSAAALAPLVGRIVHILCTDKNEHVRAIAFLALEASDRASLSPHAATIREQAALSDYEAVSWAKRTVLNKLAEYERLNPAEA